MVLVGLDPGYASFGWVVVGVGTGGGLACLDAGVIRTRPEVKPKYVDDLRRVGIIAERLRELNEAHSPTFIAAESMSWPRFTRAVQSIAFAWGAIGSVFNSRVVVQRRPQELKVDLCGKKTATKQEVEDEACKRIKGLREQLSHLPKTQQNHAADAAAAVLSAMESQVVQLAMSISRTGR